MFSCLGEQPSKARFRSPTSNKKAGVGNTSCDSFGRRQKALIPWYLHIHHALKLIFGREVYSTSPWNLMINNNKPFSIFLWWRPLLLIMWLTIIYSCQMPEDWNKPFSNEFYVCVRCNCVDRTICRFLFLARTREFAVLTALSTFPVFLWIGYHIWGIICLNSL